MATIEFGGKVTNGAGSPLEGNTVDLYTATNWEAAGSATSTTTTDSDGLFAFSSIAEATYIVVINSADGTKKVLFDGRNEVQFTKVDIRSTLQTDTINEATAGAGVTIDGVLVKDGGISVTADFGLNDAVDLEFGTGNDALMRWSTGDSSNHALVMALGQSNQVLHIAEADDVAIDWDVSANAADSEVWIHSSTSPATDYLVLGRHTGTIATVDVQGGTTLNLDIAGNTELTVTASGLNVPANSDINFTGTTGTNDIVLTNGLADALSITDGSADVVVVDTSTAGNAITFSSALTVDSLTVDDVAINGKVITMTGDTSDTIVFTAGTAGTLTLVTTDAVGSAADVTIDADGEIVIDAADAAGVIIKINGTAQFSVVDGSITPTTTNDIDLGTSSYQFKDGYFDGNLEADAVTIGGDNVLSGSIVTTLGTVTAGTWEGTAIASTYIAADAITGAKIADDAIDSEHYTDGSIDTAHLAADAVTGAKIADDAIDSEHYVDGSIDNAHLADDAVDSDELAAGAVDTAHIGDNQVTAAKIFDLARGSVLVGNSSAATAELTIGSNTYVLASDGTDIAWTAASAGAITREGGNTTEATTTSTSAVDLLSATSLTLDAISPYCLMFGARKTSGAADDGGVGFKENSTVILEAAGGSNILWRANATNEAQEGGIFEFVSARQTNYLNGNMYGGSVTMATAGQARENRSGPATDYTASHVNAQTTSFILRGIMDNASNTLAVDELHLYPFATS